MQPRVGVADELAEAQDYARLLGVDLVEAAEGAKSDQHRDDGRDDDLLRRPAAALDLVGDIDDFLFQILTGIAVSPVLHEISLPVRVFTGVLNGTVMASGCCKNRLHL